MEFGQLPVLESEGKFYAQSFAILRFLGMKYGYYPQDPLEAWRVDSTLDAINDLLAAFYKAAFAPVDEEEKKKLMQVFYDGAYDKFLGFMNKRIEQNSSHNYIVGDKITIADFALAAVAYATFLNDKNPNKGDMLPYVEKYPAFLNYLKGLGENDLKEHLSTRFEAPW